MLAKKYADLRPATPQPQRYAITHHCRQRYAERLGPNAGRYSHLKGCNRGCDKCVSLMFKLRREVDEDRRELDRVLQERLRRAKALRIDPESEVMVKLQARYAGKTLLFLHDDDCVFVIVLTPTERVVVTCYESHHSIFTNFIHTPVLIPMDLLTTDLKELAERAFGVYRKPAKAVAL